MNLQIMAHLACLFFFYQNWCIAVCEASLQSKGLEQLLEYPENHFDFIILDITLGTCFYPIIEKFNFPPAIGITAFLLPPYISSNFGNILLPTFLPWYGLPYTTEMTFMERLWNSLFVYADVFLRNVRQYSTEREIGKKYFGKNIASIADLERHISLVLANTNPLLDRPQLLPPNIIPVGGLHTRPSKTLPKDLKKILDDSEGAIIFSLGSNVRSDLLSKETQAEILRVFSQLKETVIWKFESKIENLPKNVIVRKWLSQNDLLGHPNVKLFIGHGGALSTQEAIYHGVPMLVIPFFGDQIINAKLLAHRKLGETVSFLKIPTGEFSEKLTKVLENPMYSQNMKKLSNAFRDSKETPLEKGIFWIEYALRHGGADFLNPKSRDIPFYKLMGLDLIAFVVSCSVLIFVSIYQICKYFCKRKEKEKIQ